MSQLADAIAATVNSLGEAHVGALATVYRVSGHYTVTQAIKARQAVPAPHFDTVERLNAAWATHPHLPGEGIAVALESVLAAKRATDVPVVEVVVTGPNTPAAPVRLTSEVVCQLINEATHRVTMVSYAAYQITAVIAALDAAAARGVRVNLIVESAENLEGGGGADAYGKYDVYHWPTESRNPPDAKLHAKAVIVDNRDVLLTSANMTNAAYDKNVELGVLCRGGNIARQIQRHFDALLDRGVLQPAS